MATLTVKKVFPVLRYQPKGMRGGDVQPACGLCGASLVDTQLVPSREGNCIVCQCAVAFHSGCLDKFYNRVAPASEEKHQCPKCGNTSIARVAPINLWQAPVKQPAAQ